MLSNYQRALLLKRPSLPVNQVNRVTEFRSTFLNDSFTQRVLSCMCELFNLSSSTSGHKAQHLRWNIIPNMSVMMKNRVHAELKGDCKKVAGRLSAEKLSVTNSFQQ